MCTKGVRRALSLIAGVVIALAGAQSKAQTSGDVQAAFQRWANESLHPVGTLNLDASTADLQPLRQMIGNARIVAAQRSRTWWRRASYQATSGTDPLATLGTDPWCYLN
jgi:hypothetical protein